MSTREANGATVLMEEDNAAVTKLLLVWFIAEISEVVRRMLVRNEGEQPQELAMNAGVTERELLVREREVFVY